MHPCSLNESPQLIPTLHPDIINILFKHKSEITKQLSDILGIYEIDHLSISIQNPNQELVIFSTTPSVEYNLIIQNLWMHDKSFFPRAYYPNALFSWKEAYDQKISATIAHIKQHQHGFSYGFCISKKNDHLRCVYSFAIRRIIDNPDNYFLLRQHQFQRIGDYGYKLVSEVYQDYYQQKRKTANNLQLIVNNTERVQPRG